MSYADTSPIDGILERPEFTLEDLLDEDHIIQESKGENEKLLAFLTREEVLAKLIQCALCAATPPVSTHAIFCLQIRHHRERRWNRRQSQVEIPLRCLRAPVPRVRTHLR